ncbi:matrixin family metalloprotease [Luteolibacter soli]|uniref:Matrixin family metalloprotease n=1 Tax=Luteolibacter soli TaxID=3135280 RepID=A0ABU9AR72_9BACT
MKFRHHLPAVALLALTGSASAIKIEIRYDYDTNGFFTANPQAKTVLRAAADFYEPLIKDSLGTINPAASGYTWSGKIEHPGTGTASFVVPGFVVPADTIVIFAGGRALGGAAGKGGYGGVSISGDSDWITLVRCRGQTGAIASPATDFGPWGGYVSFDTGMSWNFSMTNPTASGVPFLSVALHELGHALGIGTCPSWTAKVSGSNFTGARAVQVYGGNVPLDTLSPGHWKDDKNGDPGVPSKAYGSFGSPHGLVQVGLMDPVVPSGSTNNLVVTDIDLAALRDVGWQLDPPLNLTSPKPRPTGSPLVFSWPSTTGFTYRLQRSPSLAAGSWTDLSTQAGNGSTQQFSSAASGLPKAFYRLTTEPAAAPAPLAAPVTFGPLSTETPPGGVEGCMCGAH